MENWIKVFEDGQQVRAEIVKGVLTERDIPAVIMSKKESAYQVLGTYEVLVKREDALSATNLIKNEISF